MKNPFRGVEGRSPEKILLALLVALALGALAVGVSSWDVASRKKALRGHVEDERAVLPAAPLAMVAAMDDVVLEAATPEWPGDHIAPELRETAARDALLARPWLYVRAAVPEISRLDAIAAATRRSDKDAFVLCLLRPPASGSFEDVRAAATKYWIGGALFEDATHHVLPLEAVHKGLWPLSRAFAAELESVDSHLWIRRMEEVYTLRTPTALALARTAASADHLVVVADELPEGMREPAVGKSLTATRRPAVLPRIEDAPHAVRVVIWSAAAKRVVLRVRTHVDARSLVPTQPAQSAWDNPVMIASHLQGCQAAMAVRATAAAP